MTRPNIFRTETKPDEDDVAGYRASQAPVGEAAGGKELSVRLFEVPPGESLCPYHYEYVEEWLVVLDGEVEVRVPSGSEPLSSGDVMCFPPGPDGAHKVSTPASADRPARLMMFSSAAVPSVAVYPDSDKIGVWTSNPDDKFMLRRVDGNVEYFDGEV